MYRLGWPASVAHNQGLVNANIFVPEENNLPSIPVIMMDDRVVQLGKRDSPWPDVIIFQRPLKDVLWQAIPLLRDQGIEVIVELDDNFHAISPRNKAWTSTTKDRRANLMRACENASLVTVTTEALAEQYGAHGRVRVLPNYVPAFYLDMTADKEALAPKVGWAGSVATHPDDLQAVGNSVAVALRAHPRWHFATVGTGVGVAKRLGLSPHHELLTTGWVALKDYPGKLAALDIGLAPLEHSAFNESKSWLKGLEYASVGVPFIATPTQPYRDLHAQGAGRLADSPKEWVYHLRALMKDQDLRKEEATRQQKIVQNLTIEANINKWVDAWTSVKGQT
ncbi:RfaG Glycosyltransferase [uncultured Caudovirales phage]|uniref:RfaG Glycosyltransferase n=1 Tax=uncultured Caudovirales phage TaxID=2100421 RepID=A0A6J5S9Z8_9CAUD|nr:RfaG Glycosyltransferase [uncultured Caudovirales phage]CAB4210235.1 RfaG Glycosyltransferase [uncultured Caudovirales phage]CAB5227548.1 RfaG Glycosyltransferase [uncultured Caudovirales phage]